ncbi:hypothetical protein PINS_up009297 [Pythium insidiosum]|nr:hypothetical protein PINS_up009297 [Pythium insidiosum]
MSSGVGRSGEKTPLLPTSDAVAQSVVHDGSAAVNYDSARDASLPPLTMSSIDSDSTGRASQASAMAVKSGGSTASRAGRVRVGLDAAVVDAQKKWKRLTDISDDNSTAKDMAREVQSEFAALRQQHELQDLHRVHIPEGDEDEDDTHDVDQREMSVAKNVSNLETLFSRVPNPELRRLDREPSGAINAMDKYVIAAAFIRDGIHGRKIGYRLDHTALFLHELFHSSSYRTVFTIIVAVSCGLAFLERPGEQDVYLLVDLFCTFLFCIDVYIRWYMSSVETKRKFLSRQPWACVRIVLLLLTFLDLGVHLASPQWNPYRYSRALRPFFFIARRRNIRIIFGSCLRALREVLLVLLLSFCLVGFFGLLGYLMFSDISNATSATYFASLSSAMYTMLLIHNCLPYMVKSMYPYFQITHWSALFFILFVLLTNLFLAKLTIAVSYKSYKKHTETMLYKRLQKRKAALYAAFDILATDVELAGEDQPDSTTERGFDLISKMERRGSSRVFLQYVERHQAAIVPQLSRHVHADYATPDLVGNLASRLRVPSTQVDKRRVDAPVQHHRRRTRRLPRSQRLLSALLASQRET